MIELKTLNEEDLAIVAMNSLGPGPVCARIFGKDHIITRFMGFKTWRHLGCQNGLEGLPKLLDYLRNHPIDFGFKRQAPLP